MKPYLASHIKYNVGNVSCRTLIFKVSLLNHKEVDAVGSLFQLWCNVKCFKPRGKHICYQPEEWIGWNSWKKSSLGFWLFLKLLWSRNMWVKYLQKKKNNSVEPKSKGVIKLSLWKVGTNGEFNWHLNTKSLSAYENVVQYITQMVELQIATTFWNLIILGRSRSSQAWTVIRLCNNSSGVSCTSL